MRYHQLKPGVTIPDKRDLLSQKNVSDKHFKEKHKNINKLSIRYLNEIKYKENNDSCFEMNTNGPDIMKIYQEKKILNPIMIKWDIKEYYREHNCDLKTWKTYVPHRLHIHGNNISNLYLIRIKDHFRICDDYI